MSIKGKHISGWIGHVLGVTELQGHPDYYVININMREHLSGPNKATDVMLIPLSKDEVAKLRSWASNFESPDNLQLVEFSGTIWTVDIASVLTLLDAQVCVLDP